MTFRNVTKCHKISHAFQSFVQKYVYLLRLDFAQIASEKGSEYILAHTGPRELDGHPLGGCGSGYGLVPGYITLPVRVQANINDVPEK